MAEVILQAVGVGYSYDGHTPALDTLNLTVRQGRRLALLGANGSGKTTLLLHLNGTLRPRTGTIQLGGAPAAYDRRGLLAWRQQVGLVFQDPDDQLFAATVRQDISFGPLNLDLPDAEVHQRVQDALDALEVADLAERPTHMLSFGQRKLAALAGVLAMRPGIMILDEPTAGLDFHAAGRMLNALGRLHMKGTTLVLATHDIDLAYAWADEVALLHNGSVVRQAPPDEVLQDKECLTQCRLRTPWALEMGSGFRRWSESSDPAIMPRTQLELISYCRQRAGLMDSHPAAGGEAGPSTAPAILLVAFGSTVPETLRTLSAIEEEVRGQFPERIVTWAFTSRTVRRQLEARGQTMPDPQEALDRLKASGVRRVVLQSLHVMPGEEYQRLLTLEAHGLELVIGAPLLNETRDLDEVRDILRTICRHDRPNVVAAHGNENHPHFNEPILKLADMLETTVPDTVVGTLNGPPGIAPFTRLAEPIARTGAVHFIPLMILSGVHVRDDLMGDNEESWKNRLAAREVTLAPALGELPEIRKILVRHIQEAENRMTNHGQ